MRDIRIFNNKFTSNDLWVLVLVYPYYFIVDYLILGSRFLTDFSVALTATCISTIVWPVSWYVHTIVGFKIRKEYPELRETGMRVALSLFLFLQITLLQNTAVTVGLSLIPNMHLVLTGEIIKSVVIAGVVLNIIATATFEATYLVNKWKNSLIETEEFKKAYLQSELDNLKNQVNPHFLFNSINSLSSLISEDTVKAEKFLSEMSKVYRYLLQNNEQELTPLRIELEFIQSYYHMLKTRYEDGIFMEINIDTKYQQYLIPPLTLQMLIENAVKHNIILDRKPLYITLTISEEKDYLKIQNNIQKKTTAIESNKIGLKNIKAKYKLLNQDEVIIVEDDNQFTVNIPLVKTNEL